jgi:hypothetical protein
MIPRFIQNWLRGLNTKKNRERRMKNCIEYYKKYGRQEAFHRWFIRWVVEHGDLYDEGQKKLFDKVFKA